MLRDQLLVDGPEGVHAGGDVTGVDVLPIVQPPDHLAAGLELAFDLGIVALVGAVVEHVVDQAAELGEGLGGRVLELRQQCLPLRLPLVLVKAWLMHALSMRGRAGPQTRRAVSYTRARARADR